MAKLELAKLLDKHDLIQEKFVDLVNKIYNLIEHIPGVQQMLAIKGVGRDTVSGFFAEVGDHQDYSYPRQIKKLAGVSLKGNTSDKHKGQIKLPNVYKGDYIIVTWLKNHLTL